MCAEEIERILPDRPKQHLPFERFDAVFRAAAREYLALLQKMAECTQKSIWGTVPHRVFRVIENGYVDDYYDFPKYRYPNIMWDHERITDSLNQRTLPSVQELLDTLWDHGLLSGRWRGPDPNRGTWELSVVQKLLQLPVCHSLLRYAIEEVIDTGELTPFSLPERALHNTALDAYTYHVLGTRRFAATCPLRFVEGSAGACWELANGLKLRILAPRDRAIYLSWSNDYLTDREILGDLSSAILEIAAPFVEWKGSTTSCTYQAWPDEPLREQICDSVDLAKWALASATGISDPPVEGVITHEDAIGCYLPRGYFRRQDSDGGLAYHVDDAIAQKAASLITSARAQMATCEDLRTALTFWGQAAVAPTLRDTLLDSVVGIERLIVSGSGDSKYRFRLHGTAFLCEKSENPAELEKLLGKLYDARSAAAHGGMVDRGSGTTLAARAQGLLGKAILRTIERLESGELQPHSVAKQVENMLIRWAVTGSSLPDSRGTLGSS